MSAGIGLAGAQLAGLMLESHVVVGSDKTVAVGPTEPGDDLARQVKNQITSEPELHLLLEWLLFLGQSAAGGVGRRLERAGYLIPAGRRVPWRGPRWMPADPDWAFAPLLRARPATDPARPLTAHAAILGRAGRRMRAAIPAGSAPSGRRAQASSRPSAC